MVVAGSGVRIRNTRHQIIKKSIKKCSVMIICFTLFALLWALFPNLPIELHMSNRHLSLNKLTFHVYISISTDWIFFKCLLIILTKTRTYQSALVFLLLNPYQPNLPLPSLYLDIPTEIRLCNPSTSLPSPSLPDTTSPPPPSLSLHRPGCLPYCGPSLAGWTFSS